MQRRLSLQLRPFVSERLLRHAAERRGRAVLRQWDRLVRQWRMVDRHVHEPMRHCSPRKHGASGRGLLLERDGFGNDGRRAGVSHPSRQYDVDAASYWRARVGERVADARVIGEWRRSDALVRIAMATSAIDAPAMRRGMPEWRTSASPRLRSLLRESSYMEDRAQHAVELALRVRRRGGNATPRVRRVARARRHRARRRRSSPMCHRDRRVAGTLVLFG